jgi:hypothetical protein
MITQISFRRLFLLLLVLLVLTVHAQDYDEADAVDGVDFDAEEVVEAVIEEAVPEPEPEAVPEPEPERVAPTPVAAEKKKLSLPKIPKIKVPDFSKKITGVVGSVKDQSKKALDKVKSISKKDAKKVAAAVVGVWGVSVGVGWLAQNAGKPAVAIKKGKK